MTTPRIVVEDVWKQFRTGERHDSLRDLIPAMARRMVRGRPDPGVLRENSFWALRGVSLTVEPGQALGIIGHNGAGKSTLLKILTRILRPELGRMNVTGRVGALIEVAAGFHPDLTGRENIFLQGAIMGMPVATIRRRFDEIVAFAGVEQFVDTPVKRYSSGMNARLGFSIAVHLEPDVLIIDEVLAVGDFTFQERAFGRMREVVRTGIPVVVVSHQLERITEICTHAMLLRRGEVVRVGRPSECVQAYVEGELPGGASTDGFRFGRLTLNGIGVDAPRVASGSRATFSVRGRIDDASTGVRSFIIGYRVRRMETGHVIFRSIDWGLELERAGELEMTISLQMNVPPGLYVVETWVGDASIQSVLGEGPTASILVDPGPTFEGSCQLNASVRL